MNQGSLETSQYHILKQDKIKDGKNEPKSIRNPDIQAKKPMEEKSPRLSCNNWGIDKGGEENNYHGNKVSLRDALCSTVSLKGKVNRKCTQR